MTFYSDMALTASQMLAEFGQLVTLRKAGIGTYDPSTGKNTRPAVNDVQVHGAVFDYPPGQVNGPGGLIQGGDRRLLLEAGTAPSLEDRVIVGPVEYIIKGFQTINPSGAVVMYDIQLKT